MYTHARAHTEARARAHTHTRIHAHAPERHVCEGCRKYVGDLILSACVSFSSSPFPISPVLLVCPAASRTAFEIDCRLVLVGVDILLICKEQNMFYESTRAVKKPCVWSRTYGYAEFLCHRQNACSYYVISWPEILYRHTHGGVTTHLQLLALFHASCLQDAH